MTQIALLCPTRGRPEQYGRMSDSMYNTSEHTKLYTGLFKDDVLASEYKNVSGESIKLSFHNMLLPDWSTVMTWNFLSRKAYDDGAELFMLAADDIIFETPGWDEALIKHYEGLENKIHVYHLGDSRNVVGTPHPIVTREYIEAMGYFLPPIFLHWYVDTWTIDIARANNCFTHFKDYELRHVKPSDTGPGDETHNRIRRMGWHERDKYVNDTCQHFLEAEKQRLTKAMQ